jgi:hypothetical protein
MAGADSGIGAPGACPAQNRKPFRKAPAREESAFAFLSYYLSM